MPPPGTPNVDLTFDGATGTINGAVYMTGLFELVPDQFSTFLEIRHNGVEQGYNTNGNLQFDERDVQNSTHAILLAEVPIVIGDGSHGTVEGVAYREFRLNLAEAGNTKQYLSLDALQIWQEESGSLTNFTPGAGFAGAHTNYLAYNLDAGADRWIGLKEGANGNGANQTEFTILVPDEFFINDPSHRYVTLYSKFGQQAGWDADSSSEEWGLSHASGGPVSAMTVHKTVTAVNGVAPPPLPEGPSVDSAGDLISYEITVANVGNTNLTGITLSDTLVTNLVLVSGDNGNSILDTGETWHYSASYEVTQNDIDTQGGGDGLLDNVVTADSAQTTPISATASVEIENEASIELTKTADVASVDSAGDVIIYTIEVENNGNIALSGLDVTDTQVNIVTPILDFNAPVLGDPLVGQVLIGDYNAGDTNQNGVEDPDDPDTPLVNESETFQYQIVGDEDGDGEQDPGETFFFSNAGDTNQNGFEDPGETFQFYNAGDTNHDGDDEGETWQFDVSHVATYVSGDDGDGLLEVGETWIYTVSYTVTQDDIDNGGVVNPALTHDNTATATTGQGANDEDTVSVPIVQNPAYSIVKEVTDVDGDGASGHVDEAEDLITYSIVVSNDGNMTLTGISVTDTLLQGANGTLSAPVESGAANGKLDVGETWTYTGTYTAQQSDINNNGGGDGDVDNTATVDSDQLAAQVSNLTQTPIDRTPAYHILKTVTDVGGDGAGGHINAAGDKITYQIVVANDGNVDLTGTLISDPLLTGANGSLGTVSGDGNDPGTLNVGETWTYIGTYTAQQSDINGNGGGDGDIDNTATAQTDELTTPQTSSTATPIDRTPAYHILKTVTDVGGDGAGGHVNAAGDVIEYQIVVSNDGNVDLTGTSVTDPLLQGTNGTLSAASGDSTDPGILNVGETWTYTGTYTAQQSDIDNNGGGDGDIDNTATLQSDELADQTSSTATPVDYNPDFTFSVTTLGYHDVNGMNGADDGDTIDFSTFFTNTGNVTLTSVAISSEDGLIAWSGPIASLAPGGTDGTTIAGTHLIQGGETELQETEIGQSDQVGNILVLLHVEYASLSPI